MNPRRDIREAGLASPVGVVAALVLAVAAIGAIGIGRMSAVRGDLQRSADASALAATELIRLHGLPFDAALQAAAEENGNFSSKNPVSYTWQVTETETEIEIKVTTRTVLALTQSIFNGSANLSRKATATLPQTVISSTEQRLPKLVLMLDYSGSMTLPITGGGASRAIDILETSVGNLLDAGLQVDYGAVFYNSGVFDFVGLGAGAENQIRNRMNNYDAGGGTNYAAPLNRARLILEGTENTGYYVLMVSDGEPNSLDGIASAANALWGMDATIFSLEIRREGSSAAQTQNLVNISGTPTDRQNPDYHFAATTGQELVNQFTNIVAEIVCRAGPVVPAPADPADMQLLLSKPGVDDIDLELVANVFDEPGTYGFQYDPGTAMVSLTDIACTAVIDDGYLLISRSTPGRLTE